MLLGDQSVVQHAPSMAHITDPSAWHLAPPRSSAGRGGFNHTGIHHSSLVELRDGRFAAIGREQSIAGRMPWSLSADGGYTWSAVPSPFPPTRGGQRPIMRRLGSIDQPLLMCSFTNDAFATACTSDGDNALPGSDNVFPIFGLYCAVSRDEGASWHWRPITDDASARGHAVEGFDGAVFQMNFQRSEPDGYMDAVVSEGGGGGLVHVVTSRNHYMFNLAWLLQTPACAPVGNADGVW